MIKLLIFLIVALEIADGFLTYSAVGKNWVQEANPLFHDTAGSGNFLIMKVLGAFLSALLLWLVYKRFPKVSYIACTGITLFYTAVCSWNMSILFRFSLL
jgi:hypothetical protein